ncbi:hypothetical protein P8452_10411 [Trifolium repens]|nr:hypothetical protein P8452_10411 [Trifolium repens]
MEIESAKCDCCGLKEDCTQDYITDVKSKFGGKWLCGLCSEAVRDEVMSGGKKAWDMDEAVKAHMSFCRKFKSNPAVRVAEDTRINLKTEMPFPAAINLIKENQHETLAFVIKSDYFYFTIQAYSLDRRLVRSSKAVSDDKGITLLQIFSVRSVFTSP